MNLFFKKTWRHTALAVVLFSGIFSYQPAEAYVGLCCGKCGGNMCLNILGAGVPETHEFRFKILPMHMQMTGMKQGTSDVSGSSLLSLPGNLYPNLPAPASSMGSMGSMSMMNMPMQMPTDASILKDNVYGKLLGRKYMAVPSKMTMDMLMLAGGYSFTDDLFIGIMAMAKKNRMDMRFNPMMQYMTGRAGYTMKSEGMGDTSLISKYRFYANDNLIPTSQMSVVLGVSLPTGSINRKNHSHPLNGNPYMHLEPYSNTGITYPRVTMPMLGSSMQMSMPIPDRKNELLPYAMQLGSGTYDPIIGLAYSGSSSPFWWGANLIYTGRWYRNEQDYALGDEADLDLYVMYQFADSFVGSLQLNGHAQGDIQGEMKESRTGQSGRSVKYNPYSEYMTPMFDPKNYGGERVSLTTGLQWQPMPLQIVELSFTAPVYERVNGTQLGQEYTVRLAYYVEILTTSSRRHPDYGKKGSKIGF